MQDMILLYTHYIFLLLFGIVLSLLFAGIRTHSLKNILILVGLFVFSGSLQLILYVLFEDSFVWKIYPIITHVPIILVLCLFYRKSIFTSFAAVTSAYLFCQPSKWIGIMCGQLTHNYAFEQIVRIITLLAVATLCWSFIAPYFSKLFSKDKRSVCIFGAIPFIYYIFDYITGVYTNLRVSYNNAVLEFLSFFLCIVFMVFCIIYYKEYEEKLDAEQKEQIIRITMMQQAKEFETIKRSKHEISLLRHDMRLLLSTLSVCINDKNHEKAQDIISSYSTIIEGTKTEHFCENDTVNYLLSDFAAKCQVKRVSFTHEIELKEIPTDELLFCSIISNALDNALNAQVNLEEHQRSINLMLKNSNGKLLLSVQNRIKDIPTFIDGIPTTTHEGHGYGVKSIVYMTQRLGGNYQFAVQNHLFTIRIII